MGIIQCFLVEKTGRVRTTHIACKEKGCNCGGRDECVGEWRRLDTGETFFGDSYDLPAGAMRWVECWDIHRDKSGNEIARYKGIGEWDNDDGRHLIVQLPGCPTDNPDHYMTHRWDIDSRCSNCGSPDDRLHRCWIRTGVPPNITVGKGGNTCNAGAGSIRLSWGKAGEYHAMLENGVLRDV